MNKVNITSIGKWMHRNARELDLKLWECLFEGGESSAVADALLPYQNSDGGFGHGLDSDNWDVNSSPYNCLYALDTLRMVHYYDMSHPVYQGIRKYLNATGPEKWMFTLPTNAQYPHASFHNYDKQYNEKESIGVIVSLSAFVLEFATDLHVYDEVRWQLDSYITRIWENELGDMGPSSYIKLVDTMKRLDIKGYNYEELEKRLIAIVNQTMQRDEEQWKSYGYRPSDFIKSRTSIFLQGNEDVVKKECEFLISTLPENDVWPVSWCWFENAKTYPREESISLHIGKARKSIERMVFLREFEYTYREKQE